MVEQATMNFGEFMVKMLLLLLLGNPKPAPFGAAAVPVEQYFIQPAPVYAEVDVGGLQRFVQQSAELKDLLQEAASAQDGMSIEQCRQQLAGQIARALKVSPTVVEEVVGEVRQIGFWLLHLDEREEKLRFLLVVDRGRSGAILPRLLGGISEQRGFLQSSMAGVSTYAIPVDGDLWLWMAEYEGKIGFARDPFALQAFLSRAKALSQVTASASRQAWPEGTILRVRGNGQAFFSNILETVRGGEYVDFLGVATFLDFPSWNSLAATFDGSHVDARLSLERESELSVALAGPDRAPALLQAVPETSDLVCVVSLREPMDLWKMIQRRCDEVSQLTGERRESNPAQEVQEGFRRDLGLDVEEDFFANVSAAGLVVPILEDDSDLERRSVFLFEARDSIKAEASIRKMLSRAGGGNEAAPALVQEDGAKVFRSDDFKIALIERFVAVAVSERAPFDEIVEQAKRRNEQNQTSLFSKLTKRYPNATSFVSFNPSKVLSAAGLKPITAGLYYRDGSLTVEADIDKATVVKTLSAVLGVPVAEGQVVR
jgi:hypothetical protein